MGFYMRKIKWMIVGAFCFCVLMVCFPDITAEASKKGISLWYGAVVPTLFPFLIMSNFIKGTGSVKKIPVKIYPFAMAFLSGYPMGARIVGDYYRDGLIDSQRLKHLLSYSMVTGPAFLIGAVGIGFYNSAQLGYILAVSHYLGALCNGMVLGGLHLTKSTIFTEQEQSRQNRECFQSNEKGYSEILTDSIFDSFRTIGIVLAYLMMFMILTDLIQFSGVLRAFGESWGSGLVKGLLEMTVGCSSISLCRTSLKIKFVLTSFLVSFGGMSVIGQSMSMLKNCPVTLGEVIKMKCCHGMISGILAFTMYTFVV